MNISDSLLNNSAIMSWAKGNTQIYNTFSSLVNRNGDLMTINSDCLEILEEIHQELITEDCNLRTFRRAVGFSKNIQNDLIPLLIFVKENKNIKNAQRIVDSTIKLLVDLTIPIEYLLPLDMIESNVGKHSIFELNSLLSTSKEAVSDSRSTKAVMDHIKQTIELDGQLSFEQCDSINNCLLLLRNILHIPEVNNSSTHSTLQNQIVWNLFTQSVDKLLILLISCPQKLFWSVSLVQLIALLYKDQHVGNLQKLLSQWLENSLSESSEDNESNTSAPFQASGDSSPFVTSDPTSDSSDTGGGNEVKTNVSPIKETKNSQTRNKALSEIKRVESTETEASSSSGVSSLLSQSSTNKSHTSSNNDQSFTSKKRECPFSASEVSDCGYGTQVENQEFVSTSSNDDDQPSQKPVHQKPHTFQKTRYITGKKTTTALEKKELRRKKLVKRSKTNTIHMKGLMHHLPTDEDISNILKEFTVDFLLKGYGILVQDLHTQLLKNIHVPIDTSHLFWLVTYFLKFATQLELDLEHLNQVLSYDLLSYLVFQGAWISEEFELKSKIACIDMKPCLRRLHLVVTAIREFLQAVETYQKMIHLNEQDKDNLLKLQLKIAETENLGSLFLLLLRQYNSKLQTKQYLQDLILTNHNYLLFLDNVSKLNNNTQRYNLMDHLKKFAAVEIMSQYGILLENFKENGEFVNNCIFTMMHHIGGDLENVSVLFQPNILKTFSQIWETDFEICDDWSDLIEYVINKFINTPRKCLAHNDLENEETNSEQKWSKELNDEFLQYYNDNNQNDETQETKSNLEESPLKRKSQISIIKELLVQDIISEEQYEEFVKTDQPVLENRVEIKADIEDAKEHPMDKVIDALKCYLVKEGRGHGVSWLQEVLLELCYAKLTLESPNKFEEDGPIIEPTIFYYCLLNLPVPLIRWTPEQNVLMKFPPFMILLHKLGFYLPVDAEKLLVRIPNFWTADFLYSKAQQLGPINKEKLKFDVEVLNSSDRIYPIHLPKYVNNNSIDQARFSNDCRQTPSLFRQTPHPNSTDWTQTAIWTDTKMPTERNNKNTQLNIIIPEEVIRCCLPVPQLSLVTTVAEIPRICSATQEDLEQDSICDTASDLTRMCVSDEDEKIILTIEEEKL